jgi:preprotein translocase subunit SecD
MKHFPLLFALLISPAIAAEPVMLFVFPSGTIKFAKGDVAQASAVIDQVMVEPVVAVRFSAAKAREFTLATSRNVGNTMKIYVCGRLISEPRIMSRIEGGSAQLSGNFNLSEATRLAERLMTGECVRS